MAEAGQHTLRTSEGKNPRAYVPEVYQIRNVSRLVDRSQHQPDRPVANFRGDLEDMLAEGEFYGLNPADLRLLAHALRACIRSDEASPEGAVVSLSGRQWGAFVGIRRRFLHNRRDPANLVNHIRARRASAEAQSIEAMLTRPVASTPITENRTNP